MFSWWPLALIITNSNLTSMEGGGEMKRWIIVIFVILAVKKFVVLASASEGDTPSPPPQTPCIVYRKYIEHCTQEEAEHICQQLFGSAYKSGYCFNDHVIECQFQQVGCPNG